MTLIDRSTTTTSQDTEINFTDLPKFGVAVARPTTLKIQPKASSTQIALIYYAIGLVAFLVLVGFASTDFESVRSLFDPLRGATFVILVVASAVGNFYPFKVPPNLYLTIPMMLYFSAFMILPAVPAALVPAIASCIWELFAVKRGSAYAARTAGMYVFAATLARTVYQNLDPDASQHFMHDISLEMLWPLLIAFVVFRFFNELIVGLTKYLQGYGVWAFRSHLLGVTGLYLLFLPGSIVLTMLRFNNGPLALTVGCILVVLTGFILNQATTSRQKANEQLELVRELNNQLAQQNERQLNLGNRINYTMDSFLTIVRDYAETSHEQEAAVVEITSTIEQLSRTASQIAGCRRQCGRGRRTSHRNRRRRSTGSSRYHRGLTGSTQ